MKYCIGLCSDLKVKKNYETQGGLAKNETWRPRGATCYIGTYIHTYGYLIYVHVCMYVQHLLHTVDSLKKVERVRNTPFGDFNAIHHLPLAS